MTDISSTGRIIAEQVMRSSETYTSGLAQSIANRGNGAWGSGPLWDAAILSMRTHAGGLAQNLENLKLLGADVLAQLTPELRQQLDDHLKNIKAVLDEIHTDRGGTFVKQLNAFDQFGQDVSSQIKELLAKADEAKAAAARESVKGADVLDWNLTEDVAKETVKVTEEAGEQIAKAAGGR
jgi:hypothetical protein